MSDAPPRPVRAPEPAPERDADELALEPMNPARPRGLVAALVLLALAAGGAYVAQKRFRSERRGDGLLRAATALGELRRCLYGDAAPEGETQALRARRRFLARARALASTPPAERSREWPYRCARPATLATHALFEARSEDPAHALLSTLVSRASTALEQAALHTGVDDRLSYVDELYEVLQRVRLPAAPAPRGEGPPDAPAWRPLTTRSLRPLLRSARAPTLRGDDPVAHRALRALFDAGDERQLCSFAPGLERGHCRRVEGTSGDDALELLGGDDEAPAVLRRRSSAGRWELLATEPSARARDGALAAAPHGAWGARAGVRLLLDEPSGGYVIAEADAGGPGAQGDAGAGPERVSLPALPNDAGALRFGPWLLGELVLAQGAGASPGATPPAQAGDAGAIAAHSDAGAGASADAGASAPEAALYALVPDNTDTGAPRWQRLEGAPRLAHPRQVRACRRANGELTAVLFADPTTSDAPAPRGDAGVARPMGSPSPDEARPALVVRVGAAGLRALRARVAPQASLSCSGDAVQLAWFDQRALAVRLLRCDEAACTERQTSLVDGDGVPVVVALGEQVLVAETPSGGQGVRVRVAPLERLADADDFTVVEDSAHRGLSVARLSYGFARGGAAVLFVTDSSAPPLTYAVRIDGPESFRAVAVAER